MVVVVLVFAVCWCPIQVRKPLNSARGKYLRETLSLQIILLLKSMGKYDLSHVNITVQIIAHVLAYSSSCINPFLYAFLSENFRKSFRKVSPTGR